MSSKRGRKRNDALPPSRARDVQRAFRARRAAHLEALEDRVAVLEHENGVLRAALSLPPSERHPLGRGPTGKEKPKAIYESNSPPLQLVDSLRRASVSNTIPTDGSDAPQSQSPISSTTATSAHDDHHMQPFEFPQWENALMIREDMVDSDGSSPPAVEGHLPPPLKISPLSFPPHQPHPVRPRDPNGIVSPDSMHSRSTSYSQSSSASSTGPDGYSPYMFSESPYQAPNQSQLSHQHLSPASSFSHFQYPISSPSSAGADHSHSSPQFPNGHESEHNHHIVNISHARHSPQQTRSGNIESLGHRRAITEPQSLRSLAMQDQAIRGRHSASHSAHPIRVPSPPPVPVINRDSVGSNKYSMM